MQAIDYEIRHGRSDVISLYPLGDIHCGTIHCTENDLRRKIKEIRDNPFAYWIGMGDYGEFITPSDPRWEPSGRSVCSWVEQDNIAECQTEWIVDLLYPIKDKCIGLLTGNHEEAIRKHNHVNVQHNICKRLGVPNLGWTSFVHLYFKRTRTSSKLIKGVFAHGSGNALTRGAKLNKLERFMGEFIADIYAYAHMHDILESSSPRITTNKNLKLINVKRTGVVTGSWFRTYTKGIAASYGEMKLYPPTTLGCPVFKLRPQDDVIWVEGSQS